jgi:hypothetical protein
MGVRRKYQALVIGVVLIFTFGLFVGRQQAKMYGEAGADPSGHVSVKAFRDGAVFYEYDEHNLITTIGSKHIRNFLGWANQTNDACENIALSNDAAPAASWTKLPGEITTLSLDRAAGTVSYVNATAFQVTHTWTAGGAQSIQCTGLHWSVTDDSDNNLFAAASISSVSLQDQDQLQVTWTVNIPDG